MEAVLCGLPAVHTMLGDGLTPQDRFERAIGREN